MHHKGFVDFIFYFLQFIIPNRKKFVKTVLKFVEKLEENQTPAKKF